MKTHQQIKTNSTGNANEEYRYQLHEQAFDCLEANDHAGFAKCFAKLLKGDPNEPWIDHLKGFMLSEAEDQAAAIPLLRRAVKELPNRTAPKVSLGIALLRNEAYDEAEAVLEAAWVMDPNNFLTLTNLASVLLTRGEKACLERAEEMLRRADKLMPNDDAILANLGHALAKQGKKTEAHAFLLRAINLDQRGEAFRRIAELYPELEATAKLKLLELKMAEVLPDGLLEPASRP